MTLTDVLTGRQIFFALTGISALATISGELAAGEDVTVTLLLLSLLAISPLMKPPAGLNRFESIIVSGVFAAFVLEGLTRSDVRILALVHFLLFVQIFLLVCQPLDVRPRKYITAISLMQLLVASTLNDDFDFFAILLVYIPVAISAMFSLYLGSIIRLPRTGAAFSDFHVSGVLVFMTLGSLLAGLALFPFIPRISAPELFAGLGIKMHQRPEATDSVKLGDMVNMLDDDTVVMTVTGDLTAPMRVAAMDHYEYGEWSSTITRFRNMRPAGDGWLTASEADLNGARPAVTLEVKMSAYNRREVPSILGTTAVRLRGFLVVRDANDILHAHRELRDGIRYQIQVLPPAGRPRAGSPTNAGVAATPVHHQYTQLPSSLSPRVYELAERITAGAAGGAGKAAAVRDYLIANYQYSVRHSRGQDIDPVEDFLFNERQGHCEYFASAMAVLLRAAGIPTRLAAGYLPGSRYPGEEEHTIRRSDAHSWTEVWFPDAGWLPFDPTPPRVEDADGWSGWIRRLARRIEHLWRTKIVDFSLERQTEYVNALRKSIAEAGAAAQRSKKYLSVWWTTHFREQKFPVIVIGGAGAMAAGAVFLVRRRRRSMNWRRTNLGLRRDARIMRRIYSEMVQILERSGHVRSLDKTPCEFSREIEQIDPVSGMLVRQVTDEYYRVRYGSSPLPDERIHLMKRLVDEIRKGGVNGSEVPVPD